LIFENGQPGEQMTQTVEQIKKDIINPDMSIDVNSAINLATQKINKIADEYIKNKDATNDGDFTKQIIDLKNSKLNEIEKNKGEYQTMAQFVTDETSTNSILIRNEGALEMMAQQPADLKNFKLLQDSKDGLTGSMQAMNGRQVDPELEDRKNGLVSEMQKQITAFDTKAGEMRGAIKAEFIDKNSVSNDEVNVLKAGAQPPESAPPEGPDAPNSTDTMANLANSLNDKIKNLMEFNVKLETTCPDPELMTATKNKITELESLRAEVNEKAAKSYEKTGTTPPYNEYTKKLDDAENNLMLAKAALEKAQVELSVTNNQRTIAAVTKAQGWVNGAEKEYNSARNAMTTPFRIGMLQQQLDGLNKRGPNA